MELLATKVEDWHPYHDRSVVEGRRNGKRRASDRKARQILHADKDFIAWDGEGINVYGVGKPQAYVLFGNSATGSIDNILGIPTYDALDFIIATGLRHPNVIHVAFAFNYDSNMIVQSLAPATLSRLHRHGFVRLTRNVSTYIITYRKSKWFQVTRLRGGERTTVRIYDIFTFFMVSFEKAYTDMCGPVPSVITKGKAGRKTFTVAEFSTVKTYWRLEIQLVRELAEELRRRVYGAGLFITEWHGPGALASYSMREHGIKQHMAVACDEVRLAARYAYAAGRFEVYRVGRILQPVWGIDLNSAYPSALRLVPSLSEGSWHHESWEVKRPGQVIRPFGLYYVRLRGPVLGAKRPSPLYHRDRHHELTFPWHTEGWYWGPEALMAVKYGHAVVTEAWQYTGWTTRPFAYIDDMYGQRQQWKREGNSAQTALKLCMNAKTGKAAQRVGWRENGRIPGWHQLEWAGFVTSYTRASLFDVMRRIPFEHLVAIETDGFYTTYDPAQLGIKASDDLGGWSVDHYEEVMYVQSGLAWLRKGICPTGCLHDQSVEDCAWTPKRRGLDKESFTLDDCTAYLDTLVPNDIAWPEFKGVTTRFATMGLALASRNVKQKHCVWTTAPREISVGRQGKRIHVPAFCGACKNGKTAYEQAHDLIIAPPSAIKDGTTKSFPHSVPWEPEVGRADYRSKMEEADLYVTG